MTQNWFFHSTGIVCCFSDAHNKGLKTQFRLALFLLFYYFNVVSFYPWNTKKVFHSFLPELPSRRPIFLTVMLALPSYQILQYLQYSYVYTWYFSKTRDIISKVGMHRHHVFCLYTTLVWEDSRTCVCIVSAGLCHGLYQTGCWYLFRHPCSPLQWTVTQILNSQDVKN